MAKDLKIFNKDKREMLLEGYDQASDDQLFQQESRDDMDGDDDGEELTNVNVTQ